MTSEEIKALYEESTSRVVSECAAQTTTVQDYEMIDEAILKFGRQVAERTYVRVAKLADAKATTMYDQTLDCRCYSHVEDLAAEIHILACDHRWQSLRPTVRPANAPDTQVCLTCGTTRVLNDSVVQEVVASS